MQMAVVLRNKLLGREYRAGQYLKLARLNSCIYLVRLKNTVIAAAIKESAYL